MGDNETISMVVGAFFFFFFRGQGQSYIRDVDWIAHTVLY
jgi:hypothetical protein